MPNSQNGWPVLQYGDPKVYTWVIPAKTGAFTLRIRNGSAGFLIAYFVLWYAEKIEPIKGKILDDWGHAVRPIGDSKWISNHASATAVDLNALAHPQGKRGTFNFLVDYKKKRITAYARIMMRLKFAMQGTLRWGENYSTTVDGMHFEINVGLSAAEDRARKLMGTSRGRRILEANPTQKAVILS